MGLKQSIVVKNEFTIRNKSGKGGSRGGTPGEYIMRYMARSGATEDLTPVKFDSEPFVSRYSGRKAVVESSSSVQESKDGMRRLQGKGGIAFGSGGVSLSDREVRRVSRVVQKAFDNGKTVMKTVLSFDHAYLRDNRLVPEGFEPYGEGSYRGNLDQMKLRLAIMNGMDRLAPMYDNLYYVGIIQVDAAHVHCHLALVDLGRGNIRPDGTQDGRITERMKSRIRRGIDMSLDEQKSVQVMSSNITLDKRNALCFIKKQVHSMVYERGVPQFLISCLPDDRRLWRAGSKDKQMRKANALVRDYVMGVLAEPDSGYAQARRHVDEYASSRQAREGLSDGEYMALRRTGEERIIEDCMNGVYSVLKRIPKDELYVRTPTMDVMGMDYEEAAARVDEDPLIEFGFKLRSYSSRLSHHREEAHKYRDAAQSYTQSQDVSEASRALYEYYLFEQQYNEKLMCKYQYFLGFLPPRDDWMGDLESLMEREKKLHDMQVFKDDPSVRRMGPSSVEDYGFRVYGIRGGRYLKTNPGVYERRQELARDDYVAAQKAFREKLADWGLTYKDGAVSKEKPYAFEDVKALDLHHLTYDFPRDFTVAQRYKDAFVEVADERTRLYERAVSYLVESGQGGYVSMLPGRDVDAMSAMARQVRSDEGRVVVAKPVLSGRYRSGATIPLDVDYTRDMRDAVRSVIDVTVQDGPDASRDMSMGG